MRWVFLAVAALLLSRHVRAQQLSIGQWRDELVYRNANSVAASATDLFCTTELSMYAVSLNDFSIRKYSKINGLSDINTTLVAYYDAMDVVLIVYANSNLDLIVKGEVINLSDIKRKNILGDKGIYGVHFSGTLAYLACGFGVVVLNLEKLEVKDTYYPSTTGLAVKVNGITEDEQYLYAATAQGLFRADKNDPFLADYRRWQLIGPSEGLFVGAYSDVVQFNGAVYAARVDTVFRLQNGTWEAYWRRPKFNVYNLDVSGNALLISQIGMGGSGVTVHYASGQRDSVSCAQPYQAVLAGGYLWVADFFQGLLRFHQGVAEPIYPNGPWTPRVFDLAVNSETHSVYVAPGGWNSSYSFTFNQDGFFARLGGWWNHYDYKNTPGLTDTFDIVCVAVDERRRKTYFGSMWNGIIEFDDEAGVTQQFDETNSTLGGTVGDILRVKVTGMALDRAGNMWISNLGAQYPIVCRTADDQWLRFQPPLFIEQNWITHVVADDYGQIWFLLPRQGILVFHPGSSLQQTTDDQYKKLINVPGSGNLPTLQVLCLTRDRNGTIWVGTDQGVAVFYCPGQVFSSFGCEAQRIIVNSGGYNGYLLETETINEILVDGANRKWIATNNGLWLFSADGTELVEHFTAENSPLFSNTVLALAMDDRNGELYIGTDRGMLVYRTDVLRAEPDVCAPAVYPNPVRENYSGPIAISGMGDNAEVRITDATGTLVYQTRALGSQVIWDGKGLNGRRVRSGVYYVFAAEADGTGTCVARLLIIN
ncbi:MAG: two-component regulator propeller domain-containing protein [Chitinophagales bacterium]|nr:two-component regulator propeller domain-containing protein [Chitinophagales bacterium]